MSAKSKTLTYASVAVVVAAAIIGAAIVTNPSFLGGVSSQASQASQAYSGGSGTLSIYLTDAPPSSQTLKYMLVNVSSVELRYEGALPSTSTSSTSTSSTVSTTTTSTSGSSTPENLYVYKVPASVGENVNLTKLHGQSLLLGATTLPSGRFSSIVLNIPGAKAFYTDGGSEQLKVVANGKLMVPFQFSVFSGGTTSLTIDITPNSLHISQGGVLTPVIHVTSVEQGPNVSATTHSTEVDESTSTS